MKRLGDVFRRWTPRTASSIPWFTKYHASYRCAFCMTNILSAAKWPQVRRLIKRVGTHVSVGVRCRLGRTNGFSWTELRRGVGHAQRDGACDGIQKEMGGVHPKDEPETFYLNHPCPQSRRLWFVGASGLL